MGFLDGKRALIVGVASPRSIAWGIAEAMHEQGAELAFTYQTDKLKPRVESIAEATGSNIVIPCDVAFDEQIDGLFERIRDAFGRLDILVNNAATNPYFGPAPGLPSEAFDKTVGVNLKGPYYMMARAVPLMAQSGGGSIVKTDPFKVGPQSVGYELTKKGLVEPGQSQSFDYPVVDMPQSPKAMTLIVKTASQ